MKRSYYFFGIALILALVFGSILSTPAFSGSQDGKVRVMVQFMPGQKAAVERALRGFGAEFHYSFDNLDTFAVTVPSAAVEGLSRNPNVLAVEEDSPRYLIGSTRSAAMGTGLFAPAAAGSETVPYGIDMVQARDVWDADRNGIVDSGAPTGAGVKVCVIDSGLYTSHEDFVGVNITGGYPSNWISDGLGHGTHVTGTITAANNSVGVVGVSPGAVSLFIVRVFGNDGSWTYSSTLIDAANRCANNGAKIISMSLGGSRPNGAERRGFDRLYRQGILSIAAAGNDANTAYSYPASYDSVMSVAALDSNEAIADFSQQNDQVEIAAPGVSVLSTVPFIDINTLTVGSTTYSANHIEFSARGTASGPLVNGGFCDSTGAWSGKVVLCERGVISFLDKVRNVQNSGGAAAVIYNNAPGNFFGTLSAGNSSTIPAISLSQEDGQALVASSLGQTGTVSSTFTQPASGYEAWDGTSMATPHVSGVAALLWSAKPSASNADIRSAMTSTAKDLGAAGRDNAFGFGLVQAKDAVDFLTGGTPPPPPPPPPSGTIHVADLDGSSFPANPKNWKATVDIKVVDAGGAAVSGASVSGSWGGGANGSGSCTTDATGWCSITSGNIKTSNNSATFTVTGVSHASFTYNPGANTDPENDSDGTTISIQSP